MWKVVFNPSEGQDIVVDKDGHYCSPQSWAAGFSSVVDPLVGAGKLINIDVSHLDRDHANPDVIVVADRVDELNAQRQATQAVQQQDEENTTGSTDKKKRK